MLTCAMNLAAQWLIEATELIACPKKMEGVALHFFLRRFAQKNALSVIPYSRGRSTVAKSNCQMPCMKPEL